MKHSIKTGLSFGLTSGIITTLGLMIGLYSSTQSKIAVLGGILTIAVADSLSDALGIHVAEESKKGSNHKDVWQATIVTFASKFIFALTFIVPVLIFTLQTAIIVSLIWAVVALSFLSYKIAKSKKENPIKVIFEHLLISAVVVVSTYYIGQFIALIETTLN